MQLLCYGFSWDDHVIRISEVVRRSVIGEEIRIYTDTDAMVPDMRAFARITGNRVVDISLEHPVMIDLVPGPNRVYSPRSDGIRATVKLWVIVLKILPTNRLHPGSSTHN